MRRVSLWIAAALVVLLVVSTVTVFTALRRPLPSHAGDIHLAGLGSSVEVIRDEHGVPHLYGDDATDLFYAQGYVHAQDRFFEMDYRRHLTAGDSRNSWGRTTRPSLPTKSSAPWAGAGSPSRSGRCWNRNPGNSSRRTPTASTPTSRSSPPAKSRWSTPCSACRWNWTRSSRGIRSTPSRGSRRWRGTCYRTLIRS